MTRVHRHKLFFIIFIFPLFVYAQPTLDTINWCFQQRPHLFAKFDTRNSFIENSRAKIFGLKLGLNYGKRLHVGLGYNQLYPPATDFDTYYYYTHPSKEKDSVAAHLRMYYVSAHVEYIFYQTKHWELSMPLQIGVGKTYYVYTMFNQKGHFQENWNFIYEPAVSVEYKFLRWFGVGADIGYRFMITSDRKINQKFNSPIYAFKFLIYYNEIFKSIFPDSKLAKKM
jgi:hypothetical protein